MLIINTPIPTTIYSVTMHNQNHVKLMYNINLPKRIIFFISDDQKVHLQLNEFKNWLKNKYPDQIIAKDSPDVEFQDPAAKPKEPDKNIPITLTGNNIQSK